MNGRLNRCERVEENGKVVTFNLWELPVVVVELTQEKEWSSYYETVG
jgi:hypothetical protein